MFKISVGISKQTVTEFPFRDRIFGAFRESDPCLMRESNERNLQIHCENKTERERDRERERERATSATEHVTL